MGAIETAAGELETLGGDSSETVRERVVEILTALGHGDAVVAFHFGRVDGHATIDLASVTNPPELNGSIEMHARHYRRYAKASSVLDYAQQKAIERRWFVEYQSFAPNLEQSAAYEEAYRPFGIRDGQRILVYDGPVLAAWVGFFVGSGRQYTKADRRRLRALGRPTRAAMLAAHRLRSLPSPEAAAELVLDADGRLLHASESGRRWATNEKRRELLQTEVRRLDRRGKRATRDSLLVDGWAAHLVRLDGGGGVRYLALLEAAPPSPILHSSCSRHRCGASAGDWSTDSPTRRSPSGWTCGLAPCAPM